jgi:hypothetical protein
MDRNALTISVCDVSIFAALRHLLKQSPFLG